MNIILGQSLRTRSVIPQLVRVIPTKFLLFRDKICKSIAGYHQDLYTGFGLDPAEPQVTDRSLLLEIVTPHSFCVWLNTWCKLNGVRARGVCVSAEDCWRHQEADDRDNLRVRL